MRPIIALLLLFILASCVQPAQINLIEPVQAKELIDKKAQTDLFVLNVHTPYQGKIEQTDSVIQDWQNIAKYEQQLPKNKDTPILVYCRSGRMSASAAQQLQELGYKTIYDLKGGMQQWKKEGFNLVDWQN